MIYQTITHPLPTKQRSEEDIVKWDMRYLDLCDLVASWSKDPSSKFGAVIVDSRNSVVSVGYNGFAAGFKDKDKRLNDRQFKYRHVVHAECNAILNARTNLTGCKIYVQMCPCSNCMSSIVQAGINTVICRAPSEDYLSRWSVDEPVQVAKECGVTLIEYSNKGE